MLSHIRRFFLIVFLILILLPVAMYIYDPLQVWHKPFFRESTIYKETNNIRLSFKNIIDNYEFNSVILGSSTMMNVSGKEIEEKFVKYGGGF